VDRLYSASMTTQTPGQVRTAAATAARKRASQERLAERLRAAGWTCIPPEESPEGEGS